MQSDVSEINTLLNTFYKSNGLGAFFLDEQMNLVACVPENHAPQDSVFLCMSQLTNFLKEIYRSAKKTEKPLQSFYTYITELNFSSDIILLHDGGEFLGAVATEPVLIQALNQDDIKKLTERAGLVLWDKNLLKSVLRKIQIIPYDRLLPLGLALYSVFRTLFSEEMPQQILERERPETVARPSRRPPLPKQEKNLPPVARHTPFSVFFSVKDAIQRGDTEDLLRKMEKINAGTIPMEQLYRQDISRSIKDSAIKSCALGCFAAIEGNAPYEKTMDLCDEFIRKAETIRNLYDLQILARDAMIAFSRTVSANGVLYTKPVNLAKKYIEEHYMEKVTLKKLGEVTGLSTFYISGLLRKETGLSLTDNINKTRVEKSKALLCNPNLHIDEVAKEVGFIHQNHYAAVFKKFTGFSPSEFRKNDGAILPQQKDHPSHSSPIVILSEQTQRLINMLSGKFDAIRIVDPIKHKSRMIGEGKISSLEETCYRFWQRNEFCDNCISRRAYVLDEMIFKLDCRGKEIFLVLAIPRTIGKETYIIELLKLIQDGTGSGFSDGLFLSQNSSIPSPEQMSGSIPSRTEIDRVLHMQVRRSRLEEQPFSVAAVQISPFFPAGVRTLAGQSLLTNIRETLSANSDGKNYWAAHYTENFFLLVMEGTSSEEARKIAEKIKEQLSPALAAYSNELHIHTGVSSLTGEIVDGESLIRSALENLHSVKG